MSTSEFLFSVVASIVAGLVLLATTATLSARVRWLLTGILGRLLDVDIDEVFSDKKAAERDIKREISKARNVAILTGRGNELQRDTFDSLFLHKPATTKVRCRVLLPETDPTRPGYTWTEQRERELATFDRAFGRDLLREQIETNVRFLEQYVAAGQAELRRFNSPHVGRVVLTERCAYFTPYRKDRHGRDSVVYKFRRGDMYDSYLRLFEQLWEATDGASVGGQ
jgi:hypothetical protein